MQNLDDFLDKYDDHLVLVGWFLMAAGMWICFISGAGWPGALFAALATVPFTFAEIRWFRESRARRKARRG